MIAAALNERGSRPTSTKERKRIYLEAIRGKLADRNIASTAQAARRMLASLRAKGR
jgi:hypothetical protein